MNDQKYQEHKERHQELHKELDELIADYIAQTGRTLGGTTLLEFMAWSYEQTERPTGGEG
jgi:hypothetical protein